ncbi:hypothetical protein [Methylorubrum extorquens]
MILIYVLFGIKRAIPLCGRLGLPVKPWLQDLCSSLFLPLRKRFDSGKAALGDSGVSTRQAERQVINPAP